jgi:hypothetical protein
MSMGKINKKKLSDKNIDRLVTLQADDVAAWEKPIIVRRTKSAAQNATDQPSVVARRGIAKCSKNLKPRI